ncbi:hypothetical protein WOLCODRAFT_157966 [Wolfiporia cocos MD-104 SS10]|uniref:Uncharacterized protein n=1 Tax=Wolfiporia cocos (strain MD-104) TaxID=742152 RepID=A0A2H3J4V0_WOLCO|nr:hypothetical protein WOLCODRAFT_157966 [Wolfiporia cocos MD-104 SS10]
MPKSIPKVLNTVNPSSRTTKSEEERTPNDDSRVPYIGSPQSESPAKRDEEGMDEAGRRTQSERKGA